MNLYQNLWQEFVLLDSFPLWTNYIMRYLVCTCSSSRVLVKWMVVKSVKMACLVWYIAFITTIETVSSRAGSFGHASHKSPSYLPPVPVFLPTSSLKSFYPSHLSAQLITLPQCGSRGINQASHLFLATKQPRDQDTIRQGNQPGDPETEQHGSQTPIDVFAVPNTKAEAQSQH